MENTPLVSICIPTYNRAGIIGQAIESALGQSYSNIEVIIVDNFSTDNTAEVVKKYSDGRLRYVPNTENVGIFGNCNRCINLAKGKYLHILHSDDYIDPRFTETCVRFFESHKNVYLTFSSAHFICGKDCRDITNFSEDRIFLAPDGLKKILLQEISIICPSVMVRREIYADIGSYSLEYPYAADYYQWLKAARKYDIAYIRDAWIHYRIGEHSESYNYLFKNPIGYLDLVKIYVRFVLDLGDERDMFLNELNVGFYQIIKNALSAGFTRSGQMPYMSPLFFSGVALNTLALVKTGTIKDILKKTGFFLLIQFAGILLSFSLLRKIVCSVLSRKGQGY